MAVTAVAYAKANITTPGDAFAGSQGSFATGVMTFNKADYGANGIPVANIVTAIRAGITIYVLMVKGVHRAGDMSHQFNWDYDTANATVRAYKPDVGGGFVEITAASDLADGDACTWLAVMTTTI